MVLYKEFKVGDLMNMKRGKRVTKKKQIKGDIPYVTAVSTNNGIDNHIGNPPFVVNNVITMSFLGDGFYHPYDVSFKDGTYGFKLKEEGKESREVYLYLLTQIKKQGSQLGDYSNGLRGNQIVEFNIELPVKTLEDTEPDWEYMEEYIKQKELAYIGKLNKEFEQKKEQLIELIGEESEYVNIEELPTAKFKIGDLFEAHLSSRQDFKEKGSIPVISGVTVNNGVIGYSDKEENKNMYESEITVSNRGEYSGTAYYQKGKFILSNNVICLQSKFEKTDEVMMYIASVINKLNYGGYSNYPTKTGIVEDELELPINPEVSDLVPDWETMEDYVNGIKHLYKHKEESKHKEKLELLYELTGWTEEDLENLGGAIIKALIEWNAMEKYIARIELQLLNRVINTLNT